MANNRFSKDLKDLLKEERKAISLDGLLQNDVISEQQDKDLLKEERKAISLDGLLQNDVISEQQDNVTYEDVLKDLDESIAEEQEKPIIEQPEETFSIEDTLPLADQPQDALPEDTTPPADQPEDALPEDTTPPADQTKDEFTTDPLAYVRKKYNISSETPDTSYQDLKDLQRRASIQRSVSNLDKALGKLGSWYDVEAKRRGYDVPGYTGGAFERSAEQAEKEFKEKQAFQEKERARKQQDLVGTKSAFDFEKGLRELAVQLEDDTAMRDPNSLISQAYRETAQNLNLKVPENATAKSLEKVLGFLKDRIKAPTLDTTTLELKDGRNVEAIFDKSTGFAREVGTGKLINPEEVVGRGYAPGFYTDPLTGEIKRVTRTGGQQSEIFSSKRKPVSEFTPEEVISFQPDIKQTEVLDKEKQRLDKLSETAISQAASIRNVRNILKSDSKFEVSAIRTQMPRVAGEVGNLNTTEQAAWEGSQAILDKAWQFLTRIGTSKLTEDNVKELEKILDAFDKTNKENFEIILDGSAQNLEKAGYAIPKSYTKNVLGPALNPRIFGEQASSVAPETEKNRGASGLTPEKRKAPPQPKGDRVKVRNPKGQTGFIPRNQLERALSEGYEVAE